ncbi:DUF262 domain-containing protein [Nitrospira moscoviensis]|uniref:GmrSD restriction endonucleases N-terminal domain-containing protein n=1 Tax=Nitrospira moscoviensis TaxID=42253 RepID=A0A0K2GA33_NITMO|nr:DUF262 domain-containing protein [Nitrospira moscoviensis]ALA57734.1 hypothetical protein NITMOv2_1306 [Nitrospira moscoviensis]
MSTHKPRGYSVNDFLSWHQRSELVLQPKFQRRDVWSHKAKSHLLDTILEGLPVPLIFIRQQIDPLKRKTVREVVDGQQRLNAVLDFIDPKDSEKPFRLDKSIHPKYGGKTFAELPKEVQNDFLSYEFSVVLLEGATDADVLDIFARLNTYSQKLTDQELLNAAFYGQFKRTVYKLGFEHLNFWRENGILTDRQIIRMAEAELVSELVVAMLDGLQAKKEKLRKFYEKYDEDFPAKGIVKKQFRATIDLISQILGEQLSTSIYSGRVLFYSLFLSFFDLTYGLPDSPIGKHPRKISRESCPLIRKNLLRLSDQFESEEERISEFVDASTKHTNDKRERTIRHKVLYECIRSAF